MARRIPQQFRMVSPKNPTVHSSGGLKPIAEWSLPADVVADKEQWQRETYLMNRIIGQVGKVNHLTAVTVAACDIKPVWVDPVTSDEFELDDLLRMDPNDSEFDPKVLAQAQAVKRVDDSFRPPIGGKAELLRTAALNIRIGGEAFLVATPTVESAPAGDSPELVWEFLSPLEMKQDRMGSTVRDKTGHRSTGISDGSLVKGTYVARVWQSDPEHSELPDCLLRKALPDCRQYVQLRDVIDASIQSRLAAGVLLVDESLSFGPPDEAADPDSDENGDPLTLDLLDHMSAPIEDRASAATLVPLVLRGEGEQLKHVRMLDLSNDGRNLASLQEQRREVLGSVGQILDAPPEMMSGRGELNHWTGFAVDTDFSSKHVIPLLELIASFSTSGFLEPMLVEFEGLDPADAASWEYRADASAITAKADKGVTFIRLFDRKVISESSLRQANGASEADAPSPEERVERILLELVASNVAYAPLLRQVEGFEDVDLTAVGAPALTSPTGGGELPPGSGPNGPRPPSPKGVTDPTGDGIGTDAPDSGGGEPQNPDQNLPGDGKPSSSAALIGLLLGEADGAMDRALERAGSRAVSRLNAKKLPQADRLRSRPKSEALSLLTPTDFEALGTSFGELLPVSEWDEFARKASGLVRDWVVATIGRNGSVSAEVSRSIGDDLAARLHTLADCDRGMKTYQNGLRVPPELIVAALELVGPVPSW